MQDSSIFDGLNVHQFAQRLANGARTQAAHDQRRLNAIMELPLRVYHVTDHQNLERIKSHGLMSTRRLYESLGIADQGPLRQKRLKCTTLAEGVVLRDQKPMPEQALRRCLVQMEPAEWYEWVNNFVFFWCDSRRAETIREKYKNSVLLTFDFRKLLSDHERFAYLTSINTGSTAHGGASRCRESFVPFEEWCRSRWASEEKARGELRKRQPKPVEFALSCDVYDIRKYLVEGD